MFPPARLSPNSKVSVTHTQKSEKTFLTAAKYSGRLSIKAPSWALTSGKIARMIPLTITKNSTRTMTVASQRGHFRASTLSVTGSRR